jgi:predicted flap endonuclease-1-like 5' DNA nuclease
MSFSVMAQSSTGSDWNWLLIFIISVVILAVALIVQTKFSKQEAAELEHHAGEAHHEEMQLASDAALEPEVASQLDETETHLESEEAYPVEPDDLKKIEGIGPKVAALINENGINTFAQLAEVPVEKLTEILDANKLQMMDPASWPRQAQLAAAGDWDALEKLQDELKGGR